MTNAHSGNQPLGKRSNNERPEAIQGSQLQFAPENELGVVFLFSEYAKRKRIRVEKIRPGFPDCIAYQKAQGKEKKIRVEFEFRSRNFKSHPGHTARGCDWIVCWEHNWPDVPASIHVVELRREYGLGFNVWIQPVSGEYAEGISEITTDDRWSVPSLAHPGDLLLFYHTRPDKMIQDLFTLTGRVHKVNAGWKSGKDYMAPIRRVCQLKSPIFLEDLRQDQILRTSPFIRANMQGRPNATEYWPHLLDRIIKRNPSVRTKLKKYAPERAGW